MNCHHCKEKCSKKGFTFKRVQRYYCRSCKKFQQFGYSYKACLSGQTERIVLLYLEGLGIRSLSRVLSISPNTVLKTLYEESLKLNRPLYILETGQIEIDELQTYVRNKEKNKKWIAYALERSTGKVIDFRIGNRSNRTLRPVVQSALLTQPCKIFTDKLPNYRSLVPSELHNTKKYRINKIERMNLQLRTDLKRLNRKTICYSKSERMLVASLKLFFWYGQD